MKRALMPLCLLFLTVSALAQMAPAPPAPQLFLIHEEIAKPSMMMQYEGITREFLSTLAEKKADPKVMTMNLFTTTDFHYIYVVPIANFGGIDAINQQFASVAQATGKDRWQDLMNRGNSTISSYNEYVVMRRPDLSYVPAEPRLKASEVRFSHWAFYYLDASKPMDVIEQVAKDYASLFRAKNVPDPFTIYMAMSGNELPLLIVSVPGRNAADFYAEQERVGAMLGADVRPLEARALANTRRYEVKDATYRPELSYPMPAAAK